MRGVLGTPSAVSLEVSRQGEDLSLLFRRQGDGESVFSKVRAPGGMETARRGSLASSVRVVRRNDGLQVFRQREQGQVKGGPEHGANDS